LLAAAPRETPRRVVGLAACMGCILALVSLDRSIRSLGQRVTAFMQPSPAPASLKSS
jgi:hypothetical protein